MIRYLLIICLLGSTTAYGVLAGGRPNAISGGNNAFAGVVNPANAVWIADRFDLGAFWTHQKSNLNNLDNNPRFPPGKIDLTYKARGLFSADIALHKQMKCFQLDSSFSLAAYSLPSQVKLQTKKPFPASGTTPILIEDKISAISAVFSVKLNNSHSVGISIDYLYFSHLREGYQNSDNPQRSVSPGHVTNNGTDHSSGVGCSLGWRWNISENLHFGAAWIRKSYCGQYRKYRGFEPHRAHNYIPQTLGAGFSYRFTPKIAGRLEVIWSNLGNLPNANNNLIQGRLNLNKRGSHKSPGPGLQDATYINLGLGYQLNGMFSFGAGFSHRIRLPKSSTIISHTYRLQAIYEVLSLGANFKFEKHELFFAISHGFKNRVSGYMPEELGGGRLVGEKQNSSISLSWGYTY